MSHENSVGEEIENKTWADETARCLPYIGFLGFFANCVNSRCNAHVGEGLKLKNCFVFITSCLGCDQKGVFEQEEFGQKNSVELNLPL